MEYKRLTKRDKFGVIALCNACRRRATELCTAEDDDGMCCINEQQNRLAELEDKIEHGKMIELPVKLTEKCYVIFGRHEKYIKEVCVIMYEIGTVDKWARVIWYEGERKLWEDFHVNELYPTREEAEKRLKELQ